MKRKNQLEIYARRYHIQTVERVYDTRVKTTGQRQELKRYHQTYIQVTTEYKEKLKEVKEKQLESAGARVENTPRPQTIATPDVHIGCTSCYSN